MNCPQEPNQCSQPDQTGGCCPSSFCHPGLINLPERQRLNLVGVEQGSKCASTFRRGATGFIVNDGMGGSILTNQPMVPVPYLRNLILGPDGKPLITSDGRQQEDVPPGVENLLVADACGKQWRYHGRPGFRSRLVWNGCSFVLEADLAEAELADFPVVADGTECGHYDAVLVNKGGGTYGLGYRLHRSRQPGFVEMWGGALNTIPTGWLICDGASVSPDVYPDLFAAIGYSWGQDGDNFRLPDYRGLFPRGADLGSGYDPDANDRSARFPGGNSGSAVGSYQEDAFQCHKHNVTNSLAVGDAGGSDSGIKSDSGSLDANKDLLEIGSAKESSCGVVRTSDETRPKNAAVIMVIYAGCTISP